MAGLFHEAPLEPPHREDHGERGRGQDIGEVKEGARFDVSLRAPPTTRFPCLRWL